MNISVAMTTYNGASYLREQLDSILTQTRLPDEMIVCDDRSTDSTTDILEEYSLRAPFPMKIVRNQKRLGSTKNFEQGIRLCAGDIIALSDQDDVWRSHKLDTIERRFEADRGLGLVFTNGDLIDQYGTSLREKMWSRFSFGRRLRDLLKGPRASDLLLSRCFMTGATMAFRSSFRNLVLPIPEVETFIHDRWIAVMIGGVARIDAIDETLIGYRLHSQQQMGVGNEPILHRYFTPYNCSSDYAALTIMRERLINAPLSMTNPLFLRALEVRQKHLAARSAFSESLVPRLKAVASEYRSGRYQLYPLGRGYAVKDLLVGTR